MVQYMFEYASLIVIKCEKKTVGSLGNFTINGSHNPITVNTNENNDNFKMRIEIRKNKRN